jgi:hypothetical protein
MFGSSLPAVVCRTADVLSYLVQFDSIKSIDDCVWNRCKYSCVCVLFFKYPCGVLFYKFFPLVVILIHNYSTIFVQS